jgi:hypothetical protein
MVKNGTVKKKSVVQSIPAAEKDKRKTSLL